jgi:hypothetical protein
VSGSLARDLFGGADIIGRQVEFPGWGWTSFTVVGIAGDVPGTTLRGGGSRAIYLPHMYPPEASSITGTLFQYTPRFETIVIESERDPATLTTAVRHAIAEIDPRIPVLDVATLDEIVAGAAASERVIMRLVIVSAGTALFLGVIGIYGVLAYSVRRRGSEIAIRLALGATPGHVTRLVVAQGALVSGAGIVAGLLAAFGLTRSVASVLYETSPMDPATFAGMSLFLFAVALGGRAGCPPGGPLERIPPRRCGQNEAERRHAGRRVAPGRSRTTLARRYGRLPSTAQWAARCRRP